MSKRKLGLVSEHIAADLDHEEMVASTRAEFDSEQVVIAMAFEESKQHLQQQLKNATPAKTQVLEQNLEYEKGLHLDRLAQLGDKIKTFEAKTSATVEQRNKRRKVDTDLNDCLDIAQRGRESSTWHSIQKVRHIQYKIEPVLVTMTLDQHAQYRKVLQELKEKGFKVALYKTDQTN
tara:strand:+ start:6338 stop:6868 length:531 start_codon:yes stop_codon:yes gene_type:complete